MIRRDDRRDLAQLALTIWLLGQVAAPFVHLAIVHGSRSSGVVPPALSARPVKKLPLDSGRAPSHHHALGGAEHLAVGFVSATPAVAFAAVFTAADPPELLPRTAPRAGPWLHPSMPMGP